MRKEQCWELRKRRALSEKGLKEDSKKERKIK
jgi:hypothetical protein